MKIAVFDPIVTASSPSGSCHKTILEGLSGEHQFCVFNAKTDVRPDANVDIVHVPMIARPLILSFVSYMCTAPVIFRLERMAKRFKCNLNVRVYPS